jgi:two-component system, NtrC family, nitrogen regulation sensor histidine kinase GlnL
VDTTTFWPQLSTAAACLDARQALHAPNPALCELLGLGARRLEGMTLSGLAPSRPELVEAFRRVLDEQRVVQLRDFALTDATGTAVAVDLTLSPLAAGGALLEAHALAPAARESTVQLSESLRGFAHEVKNPLAGLRGAAQLIARRVVDEGVKELAGLIIAEADRLAQLADRLLQGSAASRYGAVNIHEVLERVAALLASQAGAVILRDFDPSLPVLQGGADRLTQLLLNLGRNALEAGADRLVLRSRAEHSARIHDRVVKLALRVDVVDNGRGVPAALADTLFLPMVSGRPDGSGLGLALCREIAAEHNGALNYRSRAGETVFSLLLPYGDTHG